LILFSLFIAHEHPMPSVHDNVLAISSVSRLAVLYGHHSHYKILRGTP